LLGSVSAGIFHDEGSAKVPPRRQKTMFGTEDVPFGGPTMTLPETFVPFKNPFPIENVAPVNLTERGSCALSPSAYPGAILILIVARFSTSLSCGIPHDCRAF